MARTKRGCVNTKQVIQKLYAGRAGAIQVCSEARIGSPEYQAAASARRAIDELAETLTGDRVYFHTKPHS